MKSVKQVCGSFVSALTRLKHDCRWRPAHETLFGVRPIAFLLPFIAVAAAIATSSAGTRTATAAERAACVAKIQPRIDSIDAKMRAGYSGSEGERLADQRRKLEDALAKCRRIPSPEVTK